MDWTNRSTTLDLWALNGLQSPECREKNLVAERDGGGSLKSGRSFGDCKGQRLQRYQRRGGCAGGCFSQLQSSYVQPRVWGLGFFQPDLDTGTPTDLLHWPVLVGSPRLRDYESQPNGSPRARSPNRDTKPWRRTAWRGPTTGSRQTPVESRPSGDLTTL